jgi:Flp pilus assembly protein TadD
MNKKIITAIIGTALTFSLAGCGTSQSSSQSNNSTQSKSSSTSNHDHSMKDMKGMKMDNQNQPLAKAFQDELNGFTTVEQDIQKGNYTSANTLAGNLHDEFHAAILPPLTDKKGKTYAEDIHGKYDELQDAITSKNKSKIAELIKVNRDNLDTVAKILGVSIK